MENYIFVLGADDPEMERIRTLLSAIEIKFVQKECKTPKDAYLIDSDQVIKRETLNDVVVLVECRYDVQKISAPSVFVDHHNLGDPGYGQPPSKFWEASSIGQVHKILGETPTYIDLVTAACDHCLSAAYRGECPGVSPQDVLSFRLHSRSRFQGIELSELEAKISKAREVILSAPKDPSGVVIVHRFVPELVEAALIEGVAYESLIEEKDGKKKLVLGGHTNKNLVNSWMTYQRSLGREVYGDPARGFAGAYI